jgi:hypothetical protein
MSFFFFSVEIYAVILVFLVEQRRRFSVLSSLTVTNLFGFESAISLHLYREKYNEMQLTSHGITATCDEDDALTLCK